MKKKGSAFTAPKKSTPKVKIVSRSLAERVRSHYTSKHSIDFPAIPVKDGKAHIPTMPPDLTAVTSQRLGQLYQEYKAFLDYVVGVLTLSDIDKLEEEKEESLAKARAVLVREGEGDGTQQSRKAGAEVDPAVVEKKTRAMEAKARYVFLKNRVEQLEGDIKLISREMSRRETEIERNRK